MADNTKKTFVGVAGQTMARELLIAYVNTGTASNPVWSILGTRVEDSSMEYDWSTNTKRDIVGAVRNSMRKPTVTQSFEPCELDSGESALEHIYNLAIVQQNAQALANQDLLVVHGEAGWAERYSASMIEATGLGGEGGGDLGMPINVTYGGTRTLGTVTGSGANITFVPDGE